MIVNVDKDKNCFVFICIKSILDPIDKIQKLLPKVLFPNNFYLEINIYDVHTQRLAMNI